MRFWFSCLVLAGAILATPAWAQKVPSAYEDRRDGYVYNGRQNMPFQLYGVAIKWDRACSAGRAAECIRLAQAFETGLGDLEADMRVVIGYYILACKKGSGLGCAKSAEILRDGSAGFTNEPLAQEMAARGCDVLKHQPSCAGKAVGLASGGDPAQAAALIDTACASGADDGCRLKANALFYDRGDSASRAQALPMFESACQTKRAWGCQGMADAYGQGLGVARNVQRAADYARIGCTQGQGNRLRLCTLHGINLAQPGDKATLNRGENFLDASCRGGDGIACNHIGRIGMSRVAGVTTTQNEGRYYLRRGCDLNYGPACTYLATAYASGNGINRNSAVALSLNEKGCRLGDAEGCATARRLLDAEPGLRAGIPAIDPSLPVDEQLRRARQAVESGDRMMGVYAVHRLVQESNEDAQWLFGGWLYYGLDGVFDTSRRGDGLILFENAASVGHVDAAVFMGMAYWYGDGVPEDRTKGERFMLIAATRGSPMAAAIYRSMKAEPIRQENARRQKEYQDWAASRRASWTQSWASWTPSFSGSSYTPPSYSGPSVSSIINESNWNQRINYLSGSTTACPISNPYC